MITWELTIPAPTGWINANDRRHWAAVADDIRQWRIATATHARAAQLPRGLDQVHITATLRFVGPARRRDPANWAPTAKAAVDGLVAYGLIVDDDHEHLSGPDMRMGEPWTNRSAFGPNGALVLTIEEET